MPNPIERDFAILRQGSPALSSACALDVTEILVHLAGDVSGKCESTHSCMACGVPALHRLLCESCGNSLLGDAVLGERQIDSQWRRRTHSKLIMLRMLSAHSTYAALVDPFGRAHLITMSPRQRKPYMIGRSPRSDLFIAHRHVSWQHAACGFVAMTGHCSSRIARAPMEPPWQDGPSSNPLVLPAATASRSPGSGFCSMYCRRRRSRHCLAHSSELLRCAARLSALYRSPTTGPTIQKSPSMSLASPSSSTVGR